MRKAHSTKPDTAWRISRGDARATIKLLRHQLQAYSHVPQVAKNGSLVKRRSARRVPDHLPEPLQRLLEVYQQRHHEFELEPVCYLVFGATDEKINGLELEDLPDEEELVVLSCTESAADITEVYVQTHTLLVRQRQKK
jgi:hypothetical protein